MELSTDNVPFVVSITTYWSKDWSKYDIDTVYINKSHTVNSFAKITVNLSNLYLKNISFFCSVFPFKHVLMNPPKNPPMPSFLFPWPNTCFLYSFERINSWQLFPLFTSSSLSLWMWQTATLFGRRWSLVLLRQVFSLLKAAEPSDPSSEIPVAAPARWAPPDCKMRSQWEDWVCVSGINNFLQLRKCSAKRKGGLTAT